MSEIKVALFGVGGYGANYPYTIANPRREGVKLVGAVDPYCKNCELCPVYDTAEELYANCQPDLVVVSTPIHLHVEQAVMAFEHGCHVALEKPIAADLEGVQKILDARDKAGKLLSIGFHLCADEAILEVKKDIDAGLFGKPKMLKSIVLWPRGHAYYSRGSGWAGKRYAKNGAPIFDNVLSNATAHYLMNILFMLGEGLEEIECRTFRANPIETFDTAVVKGKTASGAEAFIAVTHAGDPDLKQDPLFRYEFENATLCFNEVGRDRGVRFVARFNDGTVKEYSEVGKGHMENFWNLIDAIRGEADVHCTGEIAARHVAAMEQMRKIQPDAVAFPTHWLCEKNEYTYVPGLVKAMYECFETCTLPNWDLSADKLGEDE